MPKCLFDLKVFTLSTLKVSDCMSDVPDNKSVRLLLLLLFCSKSISLSFYCVHCDVTRNLVYNALLECSLDIIYIETTKHKNYISGSKCLLKNSIFMHLSMLSPRVGGGVGGGNREDPGEFDILMEARVKFPTPRHLLNVNFPPLLQLMEMCRQRLNVKIPTQGKALSVNFSWVAPPLL